MTKSSFGTILGENITKQDKLTVPYKNFMQFLCNWDGPSITPTLPILCCFDDFLWFELISVKVFMLFFQIWTVLQAGMRADIQIIEYLGICYHTHVRQQKIWPNWSKFLKISEEKNQYLRLIFKYFKRFCETIPIELKPCIFSYAHFIELCLTDIFENIIMLPEMQELFACLLVGGALVPAGLKLILGWGPPGPPPGKKSPGNLPPG